MTSYGPYKRFTIRTLDAIITITGSNMIATVTGCEGSAPPQDFSIVEEDSSQTPHNGSEDPAITSGRENHPPSVSSKSSGYSSPVHLQPSTSGDLEPAVLPTPAMEKTPWQCPPDVPSKFAATNETRVSDSKDHEDIVSVTDGAYTSPYHSDVEQGYESIVISSDSDFSDSESPTSRELQPLGSKRKYSNGEESGESSESDQTVEARKHMLSNVHELSGGAGNISSNSNSLNSELEVQSAITHGQPAPSTGLESHSCHVCGKSFFTALDLRCHSSHHKGERPYSCSVCGKTFARSRNLSQHARIHSGVRPYLCNTCGKSFTQSKNLAQHARTHSSERPYSCHICGKTFKQSSYMPTHLRIHTGERPFSCTTCGKAFTQSGSLTQHLRTHDRERSFLCEVCGKTFKRSGHLATHLRTHMGIRPYSCNTCGKTFTTSGTLLQHIRVHTRETPYPYNICSNSFNQSSYVILRTHTGN